MRPSRLTSVISVMTSPAPPTARLPRWTRCQSSGVPSSAEYWHMGETTTRFCSTSSRRRKGVNMGGGAGAGARGARDAALLGGAAGEPVVDGGHQRRVAQRQVLVGDAQAAGQQAEGELQRLEVAVALGLLEPLEAGLGRALECSRPPAGARPRRRRGRPRPSGAAASASCRAMASSMASLVPEPIEKCAVWAASPSSTTLPWCQRRLRTVGKLPPDGAVGDERVAGQLVGEQPLEVGDGALLAGLLEAGRAQGRLGALDDEGRGALGVAVGVHPPQAVRAVLEVEGEGGEREAVWDRLAAQEPQCGYCSLGLSCRNCAMGPCRVNPFGQRAAAVAELRAWAYDVGDAGEAAAVA